MCVLYEPQLRRTYHRHVTSFMTYFHELQFVHLPLLQNRVNFAS